MMRHSEVTKVPAEPSDTEDQEVAKMFGDERTGTNFAGRSLRRPIQKRPVRRSIIGLLAVAAFALLVSSCYFQIRESLTVNKVSGVSSVRRLAGEDDQERKRKERGKRPAKGAAHKKKAEPCQPPPAEAAPGPSGVQPPVVTLGQPVAAGPPPEEGPAPKKARGPFQLPPTQHPGPGIPGVQAQVAPGVEPLRVPGSGDTAVGRKIVEALERTHILLDVIDRPGTRSPTRFELANLLLQQVVHVLRSGLASDAAFSPVDRFRAGDLVLRIRNALVTARGTCIFHETNMGTLARDMWGQVHTARELLNSPGARDILREGAMETVQALNLIYDQSSDELYWRKAEADEILGKYQNEVVYISQESETSVRANQAYTAAMQAYRTQKAQWEATVKVMQSQGVVDPSMYPPEPQPPEAPRPPQIFPAENRVEFLRNLLTSRMLDLLRATVDAAAQCIERDKQQDAVILVRNVVEFAAHCLGGNARFIPNLVRPSLLGALGALEEFAFLRISRGPRLGAETEGAEEIPEDRAQIAANVSGLMLELRQRLEGAATVLPLLDSRALAMVLTALPMTIHLKEEVTKLLAALVAGDAERLSNCQHNIWMSSQSQEQINLETARIVKLPEPKQ